MHEFDNNYLTDLRELYSVATVGIM